MRPSIVSVIAAALVAGTALAQAVQHPFYGVFGPNSPEVVTDGWRPGDIVRREPTTSGTPNAASSRGAAAALGFPTGLIAPENIEISAITYANDVFYPWGPSAPLTVSYNNGGQTAYYSRTTTVMFSVDEGTVVDQYNSTTTPKATVQTCGNSPVAAQIFRTSLTSISTTSSADPTVQPSNASTSGYCGLGRTNGANRTSLNAMAFEPNSSTAGGIPVFFTLSRATCAAIRAVASQQNSPYAVYANLRPNHIMFASGNTWPYSVFEGDNPTNGPFKQDDAIKALSVGSAGHCMCTLDEYSPSITGAGGAPILSLARYGSTPVNATVNSVIGFVPSTATLWMPTLTAPTGLAFNTPFLAIDPAWLGLNGAPNNPNGSPLNYDIINSIQIGDPPLDDSDPDMLPLNGSPGDYVAERAHILVDGVAGDVGGVCPVTTFVGKEVSISVELGNIDPAVSDWSTILSDPATGWWSLLMKAELAGTGGTNAVSSELTFVSNTLSGIEYLTYFDLDVNGSNPAIAVAGTSPWWPHANPLTGGTTDWTVTLQDGMPLAGSYTLQIVAVRIDPLTQLPIQIGTSNCVELHVREVDACLYNP